MVVCGSANSWILDKLINNHGGLYNRVTYEIKLSPFTLKECEELYKDNGVSLESLATRNAGYTRKEILVLSDGHIVEDGKYEELIEQGGFFAELVERQRLEV